VLYQNQALSTMPSMARATFEFNAGIQEMALTQAWSGRASAVKARMVSE